MDEYAGLVEVNENIKGIMKGWVSVLSSPANGSQTFPIFHVELWFFGPIFCI